MTRARTSSAPMGQGVTRTLGAASAAFGAVSGAVSAVSAVGTQVGNFFKGNMFNGNAGAQNPNPSTGANNDLKDFYG